MRTSGGWYVLHLARQLKNNAVMTEEQVRCPLDVEYALPAVALLMPGEMGVRAGILSGGAGRWNTALSATRLQSLWSTRSTPSRCSKRIEAVKEHAESRRAGYPADVCQPVKEINNSGFDLPPRQVAFVKQGRNCGQGGAGRGGSDGQVVVVVVASGGLAAAPLAAGETGAAATAGAGVALTTDVAAGTAITEGAGGQVINLAARRAALQLARSAAAKKLALAAGVLLVVGTSRDALAADGKSAAATPDGARRAGCAPRADPGCRRRKGRRAARCGHSARRRTGVPAGTPPAEEQRGLGDGTGAAQAGGLGSMP